MLFIKQTNKKERKRKEKEGILTKPLLSKPFNDKKLIFSHYFQYLQEKLDRS